MHTLATLAVALPSLMSYAAAGQETTCSGRKSMQHGNCLLQTKLEAGTGIVASEEDDAKPHEGGVRHEGANDILRRMQRDTPQICPTATVRAALPGHNNEKLTGQTAETCQVACLGRSWCKSFDFNTVDWSTCYLSNMTAADVELVVSKKYMHFNCEAIDLHELVKSWTIEDATWSQQLAQVKDARMQNAAAKWEQLVLIVKEKKSLDNFKQIGQELLGLYHDMGIPTAAHQHLLDLLASHMQYKKGDEQWIHDDLELIALGVAADMAELAADMSARVDEELAKVAEREAAAAQAAQADAAARKRQEAVRKTRADINELKSEVRAVVRRVRLQILHVTYLRPASKTALEALLRSLDDIAVHLWNWTYDLSYRKINEAETVLEEARSDFARLSGQVTEFENDLASHSRSAEHPCGGLVHPSSHNPCWKEAREQGW